MTTTTGLDYIGATEREAERVWNAWIAAGRPAQLVLPFPVALPWVDDILRAARGE